MKMNLLKGWIWIESMALVLAVIFGSASISAQTGYDNPKMSDDLDLMFNQNPNSELIIPVVVQTKAIPSQSILDEIGATAVKMRNMYVVTGKVPVYAVDDIAARTEVLYVSFDRQAKKTGHISLTTGADAARALGGATPFDGT